MRSHEDTARLHGWPWTSDALTSNSALDTKICTKHNGRVWNHENGSWNTFWPVRICLERDIKGHTWHLDTVWLIISRRKQWLRNHPQKDLGLIPSWGSYWRHKENVLRSKNDQIYMLLLSIDQNLPTYCRCVRQCCFPGQPPSCPLTLYIILYCMNLYTGSNHNSVPFSKHQVDSKP